MLVINRGMFSFTDIFLISSYFQEKDSNFCSNKLQLLKNNFIILFYFNDNFLI